MSDQNGNQHCPCGLRGVIDAHIEDFGHFKRKMEVSMEHTAATHNYVHTLQEDTKHLRLLPDIKERVEEHGETLVKTLHTLGNKLFGLLAIFVVALVVIVIIVLLKDSRKEFRATGGGFSITDPRPLEPGK